MGIYLIDANTDPNDLVGRYVMSPCQTTIAGVREPRLVVSVNRKTLTTKMVPRYWNKSENRYSVLKGKEDGMILSREHEETMQLRSFNMACDTLMECEALLLQSDRLEQFYHQMIKDSKTQLQSLASGPVPPKQDHALETSDENSQTADERAPSGPRM